MKNSNFVKRRMRNVEWLRDLVHWAYQTDMVNGRRARRQDDQFVELIRDYRERYPEAFDPPGYLVKSRALLLGGWQPPPRPKLLPREIRVFTAAPVVVGSVTPHTEFARSFDSCSFDFGEYIRPIGAGERSARSRLQQELLSACEAGHRERPFDLAWISASNSFVAAETRRDSGRCEFLSRCSMRTRSISIWKTPDAASPTAKSRWSARRTCTSRIRWNAPVGIWLRAPQHTSGQWEWTRTSSVSYPRRDPVCPKFCGPCYGRRRKFMKSLSCLGVKVNCFGPGWGARILTDKEKIEVFSRSAINLGIGATGYSERVTCVKGRDLEVPGSGNVYLTTYDHELARLWAVGKEILCYSNEVDCAEQIHYYLHRPDELAQIRRAARARALKDHTWTAKMEAFLRWMGILAYDAKGPEKSTPLEAAEDNMDCELRR